MESCARKHGIYQQQYTSKGVKFQSPGLFLVVKGLKYQTPGGFRYMYHISTVNILGSICIRSFSLDDGRLQSRTKVSCKASTSRLM